MIHLHTERLLIRPIAEADWRDVQKIREDFSASPYAQYDRPFSTRDEDVQARITRWSKACVGTDHLFFAICLGCTVIGYAAFNHRENGYEVGYCFHSAHHRKGYAKESLSALFERLHSLGISRFTAGTALRNLPSVALLHSLGFTQTGMEKVSFYKDAQGNDIVFDGGIFELDSGNALSR